MHLLRSDDRMPAYIVHTIQPMHKQRVTTSSYHQTKKQPDQTERTQSVPS